MNRLSIRFKLTAAFSILLGLIVAPLIVCWTTLAQVDHLNERSRIAHEVLDAHLMLAERGQRLLRYERGGEINRSPGEGARRRAEVEAEFARARAAIAKEVALIGPGGAAQELEELARLDSIRSRLERAAAGRSDTDWRTLISAAVEEERRELDLIDTAGRRLSRIIQWILVASAVAALLIGAALLFWLHRSIRQPIDRLTRGTQALAAGDLSHRINLEGGDELAVLARSFDTMAADLQRQAETISKSNSLLEQTVAQRTSALADVNTRLARANERRRRFLADISHELRTPITVIRGESEVTLRGADKPAGDYRSALVRVADQARGMSRLVDDLLFVARIEAGEPRLDLQPVQLRPLVDQVVQSFRTLVEAEGGDIGFIADVCPTVDGDADRLRQLLLILLDNGMRYSSDAPNIAVNLSSAPDGAMLRIIDRGIGIAADDLPHVFDRFRRGDRARRTHGEGTGLGLPMAKAIVEAHGGTITIRSTDDSGTTVSVFLPATKVLRTAA